MNYSYITETFFWFLINYENLYLDLKLLIYYFPFYFLITQHNIAIEKQCQFSVSSAKTLTASRFQQARYCQILME